MSRVHIFATVLAALVMGVPLAAGATADAPPAPTINSHPLDPSGSSSASFTFTDAGATVTFECRLDDGGFSDCSSGSKSYSGLADGSHTFGVKAVDALANESSVTSYTWTIDTKPPPPPSIAGPPDPSNQTSASFTFSDAEAGVTFHCRLDASGFPSCSNPQLYSGLADGAHILRAKAVDAAGNESNASSFTWTIDTKPPPAPSIVSHPPNPSASSSASFTFSESEGGVSLFCKLDGDGFSNCSSGSASYAGVPDGSHTFVVKAVDAAGNESASSYPWTIDTTPPPPPLIISGPQNPSGSRSASFSFSDADPTASLQCQLDGAPFSACPSPTNYSGLADGSHTFHIKALDPIGHESPETTYTWTIDTVHPLVTLTDKPPLLTNQTTASFSFSSNRSNSTYQCKLDGGGFVSCTSPRLYSGLDDGSHTFSVQATSLGNPGPTTEYAWTVDTVPPDTAITSTPPAMSNSASANFTFTSNEVGSTFACSIDVGGITPCASPQAYSGLGDGTHTFRVEAVDPAGNADTTPASYSWQITGVGPATKDTTPPGNVKRLKRNVSYGVLKLAWARPPDADFDHVNVFVSTNSKSPARSLVYKGAATRYTEKRFKNGLYYRYAVVSYDHAGNASRGVAAVVPASILLRSPRDGAVVRTPPRLVWDEIVKATFYNVQLYYGAQKVLSAWPNHAKLSLTRRWSYAGRLFKLKKGAYHWYVWPGFGPRSKGRYGQLLGQGSFVVT